MEASTLNISGVIQNSTLLRIPYFQRRYVWEEKDWQIFAESMESTLDSDRYYFLGAIILKDEEITMEDKRKGIAKKHLVIDGQQRLTTLSIYMKALHMLTSKQMDFEKQYLQDNGQHEPVIIHSCDDKAVFREIMHLSTASTVTANSNIEAAYNYFLNYLKDAEKRGVSLYELLNVVKASITFVVISLKNEDDEQKIFDSINSLGVPLTTDELLKNFLYEAKDEDAYNNTWKKVFDIDESRTFWGTDGAARRQSKGKNNRIVERFFHAFVRVKMWDFKDKLSEAQRKSYVKMENVFTTCKDFVEKFGMDKQALAEEIIEYAKLFRANFDKEILNERIPQHFGIKRLACYILATDAYVVLPYVLYILHNKDLDQAEKNEMFGYLETYLMRRTLCVNSNLNKDYNGLFADYMIGSRIDTLEKLKKYIEEKPSESNLHMPKDSEVKQGVGGKALDENTARIIYYMFETRLVSTSAGTFNDGFNDYAAIQLMPVPKDGMYKNWPKHDDPEAEKERVTLIKTLGNYFILDSKIDNKELKKVCYSPLADKVALLKSFSTNIRSSEAQLKNIKNWAETEINFRNNGFANKFNSEIWSI